MAGSALEATAVSAFLLAVRELPYFDEVSVEYKVEGDDDKQKVVNYEINSELSQPDE